jgi:bifunctional non-homologous end joining protein LigD
LPLEPKFPTIGAAVNQLGLCSTILDGEIVALDAEGIPRFQLLQQWQKRPTAPVVYYLFDLLWSGGRDFTGKTVVQRRERLEEIITPVAGIQVGGYVEACRKSLFRLAKKKGLEGIIAKRKASVYRPAKRSSDWLRSKLDYPKNSLCAVLLKARGAALKVLARYYWLVIETASCTISDIQEVGLARRHCKRRSVA